MESIDGIEYGNLSGLTDAENDGEEVRREYSCGTESAPSASATGERHVERRRGSKREHDIMCEQDSSAATEVVKPKRRLVRSSIREQFALLHALVPNLCTDESWESILAGACEYIARLQREEAELRCELGMESNDEEELSSCENDVSCSESEESRSAVEVVRTEVGTLRIHIECGMRPGLLVAIMELLESNGLTLEEASVECEGRLVFHGVGVEMVEKHAP